VSVVAVFKCSEHGRVEILHDHLALIHVASLVQAIRDQLSEELL
jgi:hypothetical protein